MSVPSYFRAQSLWDKGLYDQALAEAERHVQYVDERTDIGQARIRSLGIRDLHRSMFGKPQGTLVPPEDVIRPFDGESGAIRKVAVLLVGSKPGISYDAMIDEVVREMGGDPRADRSDPFRTKICSAISTGEKRLGLFRRNDADCWWLTEFGKSFLSR